MKRLTFALLAPVSAMLLFGAISYGGEGDVSAKRETAKLTAKLLTGELRGNVKTRSLSGDPLYNEVNGNKAAHVDPEQSKGILEKAARKSLADWYTAEAARVLKKLDSNVPEDIKSWFSEEERSQLSLCPDALVSENLSKNFNQAFENARKRACTEQWNRLLGDVYPSEEEAESVGHDKLRAQLLDRMINKQKEPVFAENKASLGSNFVDPILEDAQEQLSQQKKILDNSTGGAAILPGDIAASMEQGLDAYRERLKKEKEAAGEKVKSKVYGAFSSVKKAISGRSDEIAAKKFLDAISGMKLTLDKDAMKSLMKGDLPKHAKKENSLKIFTDAMRDQVRQKALDEYASNAPKEKRADVLKFLGGLVSSSSDCGRILDNLLTSTISDMLLRCRNEISGEQFHEFFGPLESYTWRPEDREIDSRYNSSSVDVPEPLKMPGISPGGFDSSKLLEETSQKVLDAEKVLIGDGLQAMRNQMSIAERMEPAIRDQLKAMASLPGPDELAKTYTKRVGDEWGSVPPPRHTTSMGSPKVFSELFPRVADDIRRRAKDMLPLEVARREQEKKDGEQKAKEAIEAALASAEKARENVESQGKTEELGKGMPGISEGAGSGGPGSESGGGSPGADSGGGGGGGGMGGGDGPGDEKPGKGKLVPDLIIDFDYAPDGRVEAKFIFPKDRTKNLGFMLENVSDPEVLLPKLDDVRKVFDGMLRSSAGNDESGVKIYVAARVFDGRVNYGSVFCVRKCLEEALMKAGKDIDDSKDSKKSITAVWRDSYFRKKDKGKPDVPPSFLKGNVNVLTA